MKASIQENQMFIAEQLSDIKGLYTISETWPLDNNVDVQRLQNAFFSIAAKFSKLQTYFTIGMDAILEFNTANIAPLWTIEDIVFDMEVPPLLAAGVITKNGESFFKLQFHHALMDGWSLGVFLKHLSIAYNGNDSPADVTNTKLDNKDLCMQKPIDHAWQHYKFINPGCTESYAHGENFTIGDDVFKNILLTAKTLGVTLLPLLLYKIINFIQKHDGTESLEFAIPFACRNSSNFNQLGMFVETQLLELCLYKDLPQEQAVKLIQRQIFTLMQIPHPLSKHHGQPQIMVNFLELSHLALNLDRSVSYPITALPKTTLFDVSFEFRQKMNQLEILIFHKHDALGVKEQLFYEQLKQHFIEG
jgi:hypothetical protein